MVACRPRAQVLLGFRSNRRCGDAARQWNGETCGGWRHDQLDRARVVTERAQRRQAIVASLDDPRSLDLGDRVRRHVLEPCEEREERIQCNQVVSNGSRPR